MANQRQREARKRFRAANPNLFPPPEPPKDPSSKKKERKKKVLGVRKSQTKGVGAGGKRSSFGKHPLRVPGMKPGDICFICRSPEHIAKHCPKKSDWEKNKICLLCRRRGHSLKNCPEKTETDDKKHCYNCGETGHSLSKCPKPLQDGGTKFASCFICNETGHLSKDCPKNAHGIYPKGGCCKTCGAVTHLVKDCPNKGVKETVSSEGKNSNKKQEESWQGKLTIFRSGDDLEDDFIMDTERTSKKDKKSKSLLDTETSGANTENPIAVKPKKKPGMKVVTFVG